MRDSGLAHALLKLHGDESVMSHPKCGASWEGFAVDHVLQCYPGAEAYYWAVHNGPELDLLLFHRGRRLGFEIKWADAPSLTKSMQTAVKALALDRLFVVHPGSDRYAIAENVEAVPLTHISVRP